MAGGNIITRDYQHDKIKASLIQVMQHAWERWECTIFVCLPYRLWLYFICLWIFLLKGCFSFKHTFVCVTYIRYLTCLHSSLNLLQGQKVRRWVFKAGDKLHVSQKHIPALDQFQHAMKPTQIVSPHTQNNMILKIKL